jgi:hypothetical protein
MERKYDTASGIHYYEDLPPGYRLATLGDFHHAGRKKLGMEYLILGAYWKVYQVYHLSERTTANDLKPFIEAGTIWIKL